jgi:arabinofuranosyltransferase
MTISSAERRLALCGGLLLFVLVVIRTAWVSDDSYITFRTIDNFLNGYGLRWNIANRVQTFTHPLWLLVMTAAMFMTGEPYYTSIFLSIAFSTAAVWLVVTRLAVDLPAAVAALAILTLSRSFVEFSTSGLENALTHLLLATLFVVAFGARRDTRRFAFQLTLVGSLVVLNRLDLLLLVLPTLALCWHQLRHERVWGLVALALAPLVAWELFEIVYYGFPMPNTAYAKLKTGIPEGELVFQGLLYLLDALARDPLTPIVILSALVSPLLFSGAGWSIPAGIALQLCYIVTIGGDFMSGRFLAAPLVCGVVQLTRIPVGQFSAGWAWAMALVGLAAATAPHPVIASGAAHGRDAIPRDRLVSDLPIGAISPSQITDERRYYYPFTGLLNAQRGVAMPNHRWYHLGEEARKAGPHVAMTDAAGFVAYAAGPHVHYVDQWGLGDPLLARLPAEPPWQIGHFAPRIPADYLSALQSGQPLHDQNLAIYNEQLRIITEGPIWSWRRFRAIVAMNLGRYEHYIATYGLIRVSAAEAAASAGPPFKLSYRGMRVDVGQLTGAREVEFSVSGNDTYRVKLLSGERSVHEGRIVQRPDWQGGLTTHVLTVPAGIRFDSVLIQPSGGDSVYELGHLTIVQY